MGNIDSDHGDIRLSILGGYNGRNFFSNLILNGQIYFLANQQIGIAQGGFRVVTVICRNELYPFGICGALQTRCHLPRELIVIPERGISETVEPVPERPKACSIEVSTDLFNHAASFKRIEQAKSFGLRQSAPRLNLLKRQSFTGRAKCGE